MVLDLMDEVETKHDEFKNYLDEKFEFLSKKMGALIENTTTKKMYEEYKDYDDESTAVVDESESSTESENNEKYEKHEKEQNDEETLDESIFMLLSGEYTVEEYFDCFDDNDKTEEEGNLVETDYLKQQHEHESHENDSKKDMTTKKEAFEENEGDEHATCAVLKNTENAEDDETDEVISEGTDRSCLVDAVTT